MPTVVFCTKTWREDYDKFLSGAFERKLSSVPYDFDQTFLFLNNGIPTVAYDDLAHSANQTIEVADIAPGVMEHFKVTEDTFKGGYHYSIAELSAILYAAPYDYLCWIQGDCLGDGSDWVSEGIAILEKNPQISVISPGSEVNTWHDQVTKQDHMFSDQAWLVRVAEFNQPIYNYTEPDLPDYPPHGGDSFERLVGRYLHQTGRYRQILEEFWITHVAY